MRSLAIAVAALALSVAASDARVARATVPPPTPTPTTVAAPAPTTVPRGGQPGLPGASTTTVRLPITGADEFGTQRDDGSWSVRRYVVSGALVIAGLSFVGWAVARARNELSKPRVPDI